MIRKNFILQFVVIAAVTLFFNSCTQEDVPLTAQGDVLIKSIQRGDSIVYGVYYYAYSYDKMAKVTVYREGEDTKMTLDSIYGRYAYAHIPDSLGYKKLKPGRSKFIFNVDFDNGEHYETSDVLDSTSLKPVVIKKCSFDLENRKLTIDWDGNALSDQYTVFLENDKKEIVFQSSALNINQTDILIYSYSYGWFTNKQPEGSEKYKAVIFAYQYEPNPSPYDLQSISVSESGFIEWTIDNE